MLSQSAASRPCFCGEREARYQCPRCGAPYCGVPCFKEHGERCTSAFFEEQVMDEMSLQQKEQSEEERRRLQQIFERLRTLDADAPNALSADDPLENMSAEAEAERLQAALRALEDGEDVDAAMELLSADQRQMFQREVESDAVSSLVELWTPWWEESLSPEMLHTTKVLVEDIEQEEEGAPRPWSDIAPLASLTSVPSSPLVCYDVFDIVFAYCCTLRIHNGEWALPDAASLCVRLAASLQRQHTAAHSTVEVIDRSLDRMREVLGDGALLSASSSQSRELGPLQRRRAVCALLLKDCSVVLGSRRRTVVALCDMHAALERDSSSRRRERVLRKLSYLVSWSNDMPPQMFDAQQDSILAVARGRFDDVGKEGPEVRVRDSPTTTL